MRMPILLRRALPLAFALTAAPAAASHLELQGGRSYMDRYGANTAFAEAVFAPHPLGASRFSWAPDVSLGWIDGRDVPRYRQAPYRTRDAVTLLAAGARFRASEEHWYHPLFFSFQLAGSDRATQALSSRYQFISTLGWQGEHLSFQLRHVSNGGLHGPNRGETMALVGLGFDL